MANDENTVSVKKPESSATRENAMFELSAGLMWQDRQLLLPLYLLCVAPVLCSDLFNVLDPQTRAGLKVIERLLQLLVLYIIGWRALKTMSTQVWPLSLKSAGALCLSGFLLWLAFLLPGDFMLAFANAPQGALLVPLTFLWVIALLLFSYYYFFYFFPLLLNIREVRRVLALARTFTLNDKWLPVKVCVSPLAIMILLQQLLLTPYPDGRVFSLSLGATLLSGLYWFLSSYLGVAAGIACMSEQTWHESNLVPYRESRLTTLAIQSFDLFARLLKPNNGLKMLAIAVMLMSANYVRLAKMPPGPQIEVQSAEATGQEARVRLKLYDPDYQYTGFQPLRFRLAGETKIISKYPAKAVTPGSDEDLRFFLPKSSGELTLELTFAADRPAEELAKLEDLYLWYGGVKIDLMKFQKRE